MFGEYVFEKTSAQYASKLLLVDVDDFEEKTNYSSVFKEHGFKFIAYSDDLQFRINHTNDLDSEKKLVIMVHPGDYVPYDV